MINCFENLSYPAYIQIFNLLFFVEKILNLKLATKEKTNTNKFYRKQSRNKHFNNLDRI